MSEAGSRGPAGALERYREVIRDWSAFLEANHSPEPVTLRVRRGLTGVAPLAARLRQRGFELTGVPGLEDYLQVVGGPTSVAQTLEHWLGLFHVQQAVMALPSLALTPEPGERVLDLCAAPGGKTAHLAELMDDRGPLVAVDPKEKRLRGLMGNIFRLGHTNVLVVAADGRELPGGASFDRVLVDAPCSAEGNFRRQKGHLPARTAEFQHYVTGLQEALLRRAIRLTRPGGRVVYSTCTYAPEENEAVVNRVLADEPVELEPIALEVPHAPGLTRWGGERYAAELERAWRVYPQHLDSGGMFMARLRRLDDGRPDSGWSAIPPAFPGQDPDEARERIGRVEALLRDEYGFDARGLESLGWMVRGKNVWAQTAERWPVETWRGPQDEAPRGHWRVVCLGLRAFRAAGGGKETPTNQFLNRFQEAVKGQRRRELDSRELTRLLEGDALEPGDLPAGPVALYYRGTLLGRGMVGRSGLRSEIPSHEAERLGAILEATGR